MTTYVWTEVSGFGIGDEGDGDGELLIVPEQVLTEWLPMTEVLGCRTWGEVRALGPAVYRESLGIAGFGEFAEYVANFDITGQAPGLAPGPEARTRFLNQQEAGLPPDDQSFDAVNDIPMVADGDWPPSVHLLMGEHLPAEVLEEFAAWTYTTFNGDFAHIALDRKAAVLLRLEELGHGQRPDDRVHDLASAIF